VLVDNGEFQIKLACVSQKAADIRSEVDYQTAQLNSLLNSYEALVSCALKSFAGVTS
jgi:hypothetical protein